MRAIQGSKICVIVFSRKYADSSWCLEELEKIMECRTTLGQLVLPVFYDVDPSHVLEQSGSFGEAFDQAHGDKDADKVKRWRAALTEAANLAGWDLTTKADGHEGKVIRKIIEKITKHLNKTDLYVADYETGIDSRMQDVISLLDVGTSHDVRIVGICGMGGIGKTTLAKALYNKFHQSFEASSFLPDVRETTMQNNGMVSLQKRLLSDISKTSMTEVDHVDRGIILIRERLGCRRVFVVIDDVDQVEQLEALAIDRDSFGLGSRVLITTRDEHLLKQLGVDSIYQARVMNKEEALKLFTLHAFKTRCPPNEEYLKLSRTVVDCCGGLPLALKVLGSFLFGRPTGFWESEIKKLQIIPPLKVQKKLKISFDGLNDDTERDIFLDISCFHIGKEMDHVKKILDSCDLFPDTGIPVLIQRCLVTVNKENQLMMHDLLRDMGRAIVSAKCRDPGKWSRVWRSEDAVEVLRDESGWNFIGPAGGIFLPPSDIPEWFQWVFEGGRMNFYVPEITGSNVIAITLCFTDLGEDGHFPYYPSIDILVTNHTKLTTFSINVEPSAEIYVGFLWLGHLPSYKFNLEGGDFVEVLFKNFGFEVQKSGVSLVWDTKQPEFRVDTDRVDGMCFSCPYTGGNNNMA